MHVQKKWNFGFGTIFSLIIVYFIFLYSRDQGWKLLAFITKWYLIIVGGFFALSIAIILLILVLYLVLFSRSIFKVRSMRRKANKEKSKEFVDIEYKVKDE